MDTPPRSGPASTGSEQPAASRAWRPSRGRTAIVVLLAAACGAALYLLLTPTRTGAGRSDPAPVAAAPPAAPASPPLAGTAGLPPSPPPAPAARLPEGDADPTRDLSSYVARGENPSMAEVIERLHQHGVRAGLGAFTPPGTSPPLVGLAVPEDFALPKGYVRHHQATDDGQRIEAILMFAPDFHLLDAANNPVEMPKNLVVPPELAPPGLPIRRIVIPAASEPGRAGR